MFEPDDPLAPNGPGFAEAWHAQVLAIADSLIAGGNFSQKNWAQTLGAALTSAEKSGQPDTPETYYECAIQALETLLASNTVIDRPAQTARLQTWKRAYLNTPHGQPVLLTAGHEPV